MCVCLGSYNYISFLKSVLLSPHLCLFSLFFQMLVILHLKSLFNRTLSVTQIEISGLVYKKKQRQIDTKWLHKNCWVGFQLLCKFRAQSSSPSSSSSPPYPVSRAVNSSNSIWPEPSSSISSISFSISIVISNSCLMVAINFSALMAPSPSGSPPMATKASRRSSSDEPFYSSSRLSVIICLN